MEEQWIVKSAGTWAPRRTGAHPAAIREGKKLGVDLSQHRSNEVDAAMIEAADLVVVMTKGQKEALHCEFNTQSGKIFMLSELSSREENDIPDPVLTDAGDIEVFVQELACEVEKSVDEIIDRTRKS
jgi:protein-tyrosine-phosphatase